MSPPNLEDSQPDLPVPYTELYDPKLIITPILNENAVINGIYPVFMNLSVVNETPTRWYEITIETSWEGNDSIIAGVSNINISKEEISHYPLGYTSFNPMKTHPIFDNKVCDYIIEF